MFCKSCGVGKISKHYGMGHGSMPCQPLFFFAQANYAPTSSAFHLWWQPCRAPCKENYWTLNFFTGTEKLVTFLLIAVYFIIASYSAAVSPVFLTSPCSAARSGTQRTLSQYLSMPKLLLSVGTRSLVQMVKAVTLRVVIETMCMVQPPRLGSHEYQGHPFKRIKASEQNLPQDNNFDLPYFIVHVKIKKKSSSFYS